MSIYVCYLFVVIWTAVAVTIVEKVHARGFSALPYGPNVGPISNRNSHPFPKSMSVFPN